jgi:hypothetical protein
MAAETRQILDTLLRSAGTAPIPHSKTPQVSAAAGQAAIPPAVDPPQSPVSAAPFEQSAPDTIVRTRLEKHGGAIAPELGSQTIPVKSHVRAAPGAAAAKPVEKEKQPVTAEAIVREYGKNERQTTHRALFVGSLVNSWLIHQPERPADEQLDRASALKILRRKLLQAKFDHRSCRIDRDLRCYHAARLLGGDADSLAISAIREILPLIRRDRETSRWELLPNHAEACRGLWARMLAERISADAVRQEVDRILHPNPLPLETQRKKSRLSRLHKTLAELSIEELKQVVRWTKAELAKSQPASSPAAA